MLSGNATMPAVLICWLATRAGPYQTHSKSQARRRERSRCLPA